ncbi:MAG: SufE family protein [Anaerolineales bacterium]|nr:SufE family protein [Anaerolineales bacterium]
MLPSRLQEIVDDFSYCVGEEKLEYLLDLAEQLPDLPAWLKGKQGDMDQVHECMSPVFIFAEKHPNNTFSFHFDIPPEAPTVRGFASVLQQGMAGTTLAQIEAVPNEFYLQMGLQSVLTGQRLNGISAILAHMKTLAREE